jgi:magnesium-transporting ATPase (P-type)
VASGAESRMNGAFLRSNRQVLDLAKERGEIVLAMACSQGPEMPPRRYMFLCLVCLQNPLRPEVQDWIRRLEAENVRPVMLTGDRAETAMTVGRQAGIHHDSSYCLTGKDIAQMPFDEVARQAAHVSVFARLLPHQKGILVRLLQQSGHCVAMVGDGANDTIALRSADVGVSFVENSSPFARRASKILVHDVGDVLTIIAGAKRIKEQVEMFGMLGAIALISMLIGLYWWMLS